MQIKFKKKLSYKHYFSWLTDKKLSNPEVPNFTKSNAYDLAKEKLVKSGCSDENTTGIIEGILDAELSGIKSHGFHYLPIYCNHLKIGKINGNSHPSIEKISNKSPWTILKFLWFIKVFKLL